MLATFPPLALISFLSANGGNEMTYTELSMNNAGREERQRGWDNAISALAAARGETL